MRYTLYQRSDLACPYHITYNGTPKLVTRRNFVTIEDAIISIASCTPLMEILDYDDLGDPIDHFDSPANAYPEYFI